MNKINFIKCMVSGVFLIFVSSACKQKILDGSSFDRQNNNYSDQVTSKKKIDSDKISIIDYSRAVSIANSKEFQKYVDISFEFLHKSLNALREGKSKEKLRSAILSSIEKSDDSTLIAILFSGNKKRANNYLKRLNNAKKAFTDKYPETLDIGNNLGTQCAVGTRKVDVFLKKIESMQASLLPIVGQRPQMNRLKTNSVEEDSSFTFPDLWDTSVCGGTWQQVKLGACAALCGAGTAGWGGALCLWGCWCMLCNENSTVYDTMCGVTITP